jgi:hypothetical protein
VTSRLKTAYRALRRALPPEAADRLQRVVRRVTAWLAKRRPLRPLGLGGTGPVTLVDVRGVSVERLDEIAEEVASGPSPVHKVLLLDRPDFLGLRSRGLTFEYIPPRDSSERWFPSDADYEAFAQQRIDTIRASLGVRGPIDGSFITQPG